MAKKDQKKQAPQPGFIEDPDAVIAVQTGEEQEIDAEQDKYERMMNDIAGATEGEIVLWLHRASEKNKALHGSFLKRYPKETKFIEIFEDARDNYNGGDFVLIAKKDDVMFRKAAFTCERVIAPEKKVEKPPVDPFAQLGAAMEKALVVDRANQMLNPQSPAKGVDPVFTLMMTMMQGMNDQNKILMEAMVNNRRESGGDNSALIEAIKLGSALSGGKLPIEEGEGTIGEILKQLAPVLPQLIAGLLGRVPASSPRPAPPRGSVPIPAPAAVPAAAVPPSLAAPAAPAVPEDARALVLRRIVEEVRFTLKLPMTPKLREHVINYIDAYMPDILQQAESTTAELFAAYAVTLDPEFAGKEQFFIDLHKQYMTGLEPGEVEPGEEGAVPVS